MGVADTLFLRWLLLLFLLRAAAATFLDGDSGSSSMVATVLPSSGCSRSCEASISLVRDRRPLRDGRAVLGVGISDARLLLEVLLEGAFFATGVYSSSSSSSSFVWLEGVGVTFPGSSDSEVSSRT